MIDAVGVDTADFDLGEEESQDIDWGPLPNPIEEKPSWYNWSRLISMLSDPTQYVEIRRELNKELHRIAMERVGSKIVQTVNAGRSYDELMRDGTLYAVRAGRAELDEQVVRLSAAAGPDGREQLVEVAIVRDGDVRLRALAARGEIRATRSTVRNVSMVTIRLAGPVKVVADEAVATEPFRGREWVVGELPLPRAVQKAQENIPLAELCATPWRFTEDHGILERIEFLRLKRVPKLLNEIIAEMHGRVAYGVSCFLMVTMGAALGLIFRGGQLLSAFALTVVPAALVIVMVIMGKEMVRNPDVPVVLGLAAIWGSIILILLANLGVYGYLARK